MSKPLMAGLTLSVLALPFAFFIGSTALADAPVAETAEATPGPIKMAAVGELDPHEVFWFTYLGDNYTVAANFGPLLPTADGFEVRRWVLMVSIPGTHEPLSCLEGVVGFENADPVSIKGGTFHVELTPKRGWTWGQVTSVEAVDAVVNIDG